MIPTIDARRPEAREEIRRLRDKLSPRGDVVSPEGRRKTVELFGEPLTPSQSVERICEDVHTRGLAAVLEYSRKLDGADLTAATLRTPAADFPAAHAEARGEFLSAVRTAAANVRRYQEAILHRDVELQSAGETLRCIYRPVRRVGICVPGGAAAYPSTLLMTAVPALVAGVEEIAVVAPPTSFGAYNADLLAACHEIGVTELYRMGGAHAVAALAYGVEGVPLVDMIVGPGNLFVALAKQLVAGTVGIDMIAGPSEVVVLADDAANPAFVAADMIAQAEHSPGASILITWHPPLADAVRIELANQLANAPRGQLAKDSLEAFGAILLVDDEAAGCRLSDEIAPEHLEIVTRDPEAALARIRNAGAAFLGPLTPVAVGDYIAGPSHTLPTGGTARFASVLSANTFRKSMSVVKYERERLATVRQPLGALADVEGLDAHKQSVEVRFRDSATT